MNVQPLQWWGQLPVWEDRLLIRALQNGDPTALRRIYEKYKDDMLTIATSMLGNLGAAEDCVHDVFVDFATAAAELRLRSGLRVYLVASVANRVRHQLRRKSREVSLADRADIVAPTVEPPTQVMDCEEEARLRGALATFPHEQREAIVLHLQGQLTFREIARQQGVSINTVQSRYRYGLGKLRVLLGAGP